MEIVQIIKEMCMVREAVILTDLFGGWKSRKEKWMDKIELLADKNVIYRLSADHLYIGHHKYTRNPVKYSWELDYACRLAMEVTFGWQTLEDFIEEEGLYWLEYDFYEGPLLYTTPQRYGKLAKFK